MYNNSQDFDVILKCGDRQIHAHRVILRMWSPFFNRAFTSQFSVAQSPVFVIDPDDDSDYEPLCAILKHVYGIPLKHYRENGVCDHKNSQHYLDYGIKIFTIADRLDFPSVRRAIVDIIRKRFELFSIRHTSRFGAVLSAIPDLAEQIARVCGPHAPLLADKRLREFLLDWAVRVYSFMEKHPTFSVKLGDGSLFDAESTAEVRSRRDGIERRFSKMRAAGRKRQAETETGIP